MEFKIDLNHQELASAIAGEVLKVLKPLLLDESWVGMAVAQKTIPAQKKETGHNKSERKRRMLTVRESAGYLGIAEKTLRNRLGLRTSNPFPVKPKHIGGKVLFDVKDLDAYLDKLPTR
jgi:hypothetical protein